MSNRNDKAPPATEVVARFLCELSGFYAANPRSTSQLDYLLAWIYQQNAERKPVRPTDIVRERRFGTLPTVTDHLHQLTQRGLIDAVLGDDKRMKMLRITKAGEAVLAQRGELLAAAGLSA